MNTAQRRTEILKLLQQEEKPVAARAMASQFGVSRQVIVQDIALLRAVNKNILSTNKGYLLYAPEMDMAKVKRTVSVCHTDEQTEDELNTIVDCGGTILDVVVEHEIYGQITVDLLLKNRADISEFMRKLKNVPAKPLKELTNGDHFHTVEAESEQILDRIEEALGKKGYLRASQS